ncbi:MAG: BrnT family toxin [Deltaproteobacteria bacterium]|nr:BrnT family toxin [Deltaproteobacteria bacterium]
MQDIFNLLQDIEGFNWDKWNIDKNWVKHDVSISECEEIFINEPLLLERGKPHSSEERYAAFGRTSEGRLLAVVFTIRNNKIRIISARDISRKGRKDYEEEIKEDTEV